MLAEACSTQAEDLRDRLADADADLFRTPLVGQYCATSPGWTSVSGNCSNSPIVVDGGGRAEQVPDHREAPSPLPQLLFRHRRLLVHQGTGTHLQADEGPETLPKAHTIRMAQLGELRDLAAAQVPAGDAVAVAGDLNIEYWAGQDRRDAAGRTQAEQGAAALGGTLQTTGPGEYTFDAATNPDAAKSIPATYRDSLDYVGSLRRAEVGPVQLVHYDGGTIPSDHYPVRAEIHY